MSLAAISTERLSLRAFTIDDAPDVFAACSNPVLGQNAGWPPHESIDDSLAYITEIAPLGYIWAICEQGSSRVIGSVGLLPDPRFPEDDSTMLLGYWLAEDKWNQGYTTEAAQAVVMWGFEEQGLAKITTSHFPFNVASRRVIEKCGFVPMGLGTWPSEGPEESEQDVIWYELVNIVPQLKELSDEPYADFQAKLAPTVPREQCLGVRMPVLRKFLARFAKTPESATFLKQLPHRYYDENMLHSLLLCRIKDYDACLEALDAYLPYVDNWAACDSLNPKVFNKHRETLLPEVLRWIASPREFTCRFGLLTLMNFYLGEAFKPEYLEIPLQVTSDAYYVRMMLAWFYSEALVKQWDAAISYIEQHRLEDWTHRKAIQKACESYRIGDERKAYLRSLR